MTTDLELVQRYCADQLELISGQFKSGVKLTLLVRTPDYPERDFLMTDDDLNEVIEAFIKKEKRKRIIDKKAEF